MYQVIVDSEDVIEIIVFLRVSINKLFIDINSLYFSNAERFILLY